MVSTKPPGIDLVLSWRYGNSQSFTVTFLLNGVAINISTYTVYFMIKSAFSDTDANALISKTITSHSNPTAGVTTVTLTAAEMASKLPVKNGYCFEIKYSNTAGDVKTGTVGLLNIQQVVKLVTS